MDVGDRVCLKNNQGRKGSLLKKVVKKDRVFWSVKFDKQVTQYPESYLQLCEEDSVYDDLPTLIAKNIFQSIKPASIVLPKPTSSAIKTLFDAELMIFITGLN